MLAGINHYSARSAFWKTSITLILLLMTARTFYFNLGTFFISKALLTKDITDGERNALAGQSYRWFRRSNRPSGTSLTLGMASAEAINWINGDMLQSRACPDKGGIQVYVEKALQYNQALVLSNLPPALDGPCWILVSNLGNSTLIEQNSLLGFVNVKTQEDKTIFKPIRVGIETAEWAYDSPDLPPRHNKPSNALMWERGSPVDAGGLAYWTYWEVEPEDRVEAIAFVFLYSRRFHNVPSWNILGMFTTPDVEHCGDGLPLLTWD